MTEKEKEILGIIKTFINKNGYPPTIREICGLSGLTSTSSVHGHLMRLKAKGHITGEAGSPRSIALTKKEKKVKFLVNAIAIMCEDDKEYILLQENKKQDINDIKFELPGGVISAGEDVYGCLRRELKDKGFEITNIFGEDKCNKLSYVGEAVTVFKPFCVSQSFTNSDSIIANTILCEVDKVEAKRCSNKSSLKWICTDDLENMLVDQNRNISAHNIVALKSFCEL